MKRDRIERLRDFLRDSVPDEKFDMRDYIWTDDEDLDVYGQTPTQALKHCGTAACIAGWACAISRKKAADERGAAMWLGLDDAQASDLFRPNNYIYEGRYTRAMAVETLTRFLETGLITWRRASA